MKRLLLPPMLSTLLLVTACFWGGYDETFKLDDYEFSTIDVSTFDGDISVRYGMIQEIRAEFVGTEDTSLLEITEMGGVLVVHSMCDTAATACSINLDIEVPLGTEVIAATNSGDIDIQEIEGGAFVTTQSGTVEIVDVEGGLDVETVSGEVDLRDIDCDIDVVTINGSVDGTDIEADHLMVHTTDGKVMFELELPPAEVVINTLSGGVDLTVPTDEYDLELESLTGSVSTYGLDDIDGAARVIAIQSTSGVISVTGD